MTGVEMKIVTTEKLIHNCTDAQTEFIEQRSRDIVQAVRNVTNPPQTNTFAINPTKHGNGVLPIKQAFIQTLVNLHWQAEVTMSLVNGVNPGPLDAYYPPVNNDMAYAVEWETGNISSSHRAMNKLMLGLMNNIIVGGTLVLPSRDLYPYLTDRIGNFEELLPYFPVWRNKNINGYLSVIVVEHDTTNPNVPLIHKGTDGRALR